jgi:hypothetical protein
MDCQRGQYEKGIEAMERLLKRKAFDIPPHAMKEAEPQDMQVPIQRASSFGNQDLFIAAVHRHPMRRSIVTV